MKIFRRYRCEAEHEWVVQREDTEGELSSDSICPEGHAAVTCRIELPVDDVQVLISPAARIVDRLREQRILDGRYYLSLLDKTGSALCFTKESYEWDAVVKLAAFFRGKSVQHALEWWRKRDL